MARYLSPAASRLQPRPAPAPPAPIPRDRELRLRRRLRRNGDGARSPTTTPPRPQLFEADAHKYNQDAVMLRRTRSGRAFPPPIPVIGRSGRPWLRLRASREGGRLVLREMRLPSQELLQPFKEDGRFKLLLHTEPGARRGNAGTAREE